MEPARMAEQESRIVEKQLQAPGKDKNGIQCQPMLSDDLIGGGACQNTKILENTGCKWGSGSGLAQNLCQIHPQNAINHPDLLHAWPSFLSDESVAQFPEDASYCAIMNVGIGSGNIAQRFREPVLHRLTNEPQVLLVAHLLPRYAQTEFEGHVKTGRARLVAIKLNARQVVD